MIRPQASEKGWGAAVRMLKSIAEARGWEHNRRRHHPVTASRRRAEIGDGDIRRMFDAASALHEIFCENCIDADEVSERLDDVATLPDRLASV